MFTQRVLLTLIEILIVESHGYDRGVQTSAQEGRRVMRTSLHPTGDKQH